MNRNSNRFHTVAVGCGGYGPSQSTILAQSYLNLLGPGDVFILLTCGNDLVIF